MAKIFIAAGHGLPSVDGGAVSPFGVESAIAIGVVDAAVALLAGQNKNGREIVKVPHEYNLMDTVSYINRNSKDVPHDLCIEVHLNSNAGTPGTGTETYFGLKTLAQEVHGELIKTLGLNDRGVKDGNGYIFNNSTNPGSCLVELGFVNNSKDVQAITARGGLALAKGILKACGGVWVDKTTPTPPPTPKPQPAPVTPPKPVTPPSPTPVVVEVPADIKDNSTWVTKLRIALKAFVAAWREVSKIIGG